MADAVEAFGDVGEESPNELVGVQCHGLPPFGSIDAIILPSNRSARSAPIWRSRFFVLELTRA